jgi:multidrug efflux pump subunit AcrA (membrane-fusion protein)
MDDLSAKLSEVEEKIQSLDSTKTLTQVTVDEIALSNFEHYFEVFGNVEAPENILLSAQTAGEILSIPAKEGQTVKKGDVLLQIDAKTIRRNIDEVENSLSLATDVF